MPYQMTHLIISERLYNFYNKKINNLPQFYLGTIGPDAVQNRNNFIEDNKKDSHLCIGNEKWGLITNNDEWKENI